MDNLTIPTVCRYCGRELPVGLEIKRSKDKQIKQPFMICPYCDSTIWIFSTNSKATKTNNISGTVWFALILFVLIIVILVWLKFLR